MFNLKKKKDMGKINFTKEHMARLKELATTMLFKNDCVATTMGQHLGISELLHCTTINSLNRIKLELAKKIEQAENADEWATTDNDKRILDDLRTKRDLVNLIVGYKRYMDELAATSRERERLQEEIAQLREEQKTPADRLKEMEEKLAALNNDGGEF